MPVVALDAHSINNWNTFHAECQVAFGFPDVYGRNMDAWIDCMCGLRDDDGMTRFVLEPNEVLEIVVLHSDALRRRAPDILEALRASTEEVNERCAENGQKSVLKLVLH
ncbi:barnase inhibitor [Herbaspirillum sp. HC18]|nr:barnase inhibitor [Herbaspirillum sp. HC18]